MENFLKMTLESLSKGTVDQAIASIYYVVRVMKHIKQIGSIEQGFIVEGLNTEPSRGDAARAEEILSLIEKVEQRSLAELEKTKAEEYINKLADVLQQLVQSQLGYDLSRGRDLLYTCRADRYWKSK